MDATEAASLAHLAQAFSLWNVPTPLSADDKLKLIQLFSNRHEIEPLLSDTHERAMFCDAARETLRSVVQAERYADNPGAIIEAYLSSKLAMAPSPMRDILAQILSVEAKQTQVYERLSRCFTPEYALKNEEAIKTAARAYEAELRPYLLAGLRANGSSPNRLVAQRKRNLGAVDNWFRKLKLVEAKKTLEAGLHIAPCKEPSL